MLNKIQNFKELKNKKIKMIKQERLKLHWR